MFMRLLPRGWLTLLEQGCIFKNHYFQGIDMADGG